jgi:hypothetical protein
MAAGYLQVRETHYTAPIFCYTRTFCFERPVSPFEKGVTEPDVSIQGLCV